LEKERGGKGCAIIGHQHDEEKLKTWRKDWMPTGDIMDYMIGGKGKWEHGGKVKI